MFEQITLHSITQYERWSEFCSFPAYNQVTPFSPNSKSHSNEWLGVGSGREYPSRARRASEREVEG
ncbi:MAG: hypothetical protein JO235_11945 [Chroococcidiopsidaceae cyanobacterium CP_BM_RX_35]|nr:hypothetical protein [Chroococcidiopsidaceae cyanobacterium CP_BM_RX_35]